MFRVNKFLRNIGMNIAGTELEFRSRIPYQNINSSVFMQNAAIYQNGRIIGTDEVNERDARFVGLTTYYDSSISVSDNYPNQIEIITPPVPIENVDTYFRDLADTYRHFSEADISCGTHFHFNASELKHTELIHLMLGVSLFEPLFFAFARNSKRLEEKYCKPVGYHFNLEDLTSVKDVEDFRYLFLGHKNNYNPANLRKYGKELPYTDRNPRYSGLNIYSALFRGTVEFRYFENMDWQTNVLLFNLTKYIIYWSLNTRYSKLVELIKSCPAEGSEYLRWILDVSNLHSQELLIKGINSLLTIRPKKNVNATGALYFIEKMRTENATRLSNLQDFKKILSTHVDCIIRGIESGILHPYSASSFIVSCIEYYTGVYDPMIMKLADEMKSSLRRNPVEESLILTRFTHSGIQRQYLSTVEGKYLESINDRIKYTEAQKARRSY